MRLLLLLPLLALAACGPNDLAYPVRGVYHGPAAMQGTVSISHETVPGLMEAMRMDFAVGDTAGLGALHRGDKIAFRLVVPGGDGAPYVEGFSRLPDSTALDTAAAALHTHDAAPHGSAAHSHADTPAAASADSSANPF